MEGQALATWVGVGALIVINVVGWYLAGSRREQHDETKEAKELGMLIATVEGLRTSVDALGNRVGRLEKKVNGWILTSHKGGS